MININEIELPEFTSLYEQYDNAGGVLSFHLFRISKNYLGKLSNDEYLKHLVVARQSLEKVHYLANFHGNQLTSQSHLPEPLQINHEELPPSGVMINPEAFLGAYYDWDAKKPLIRGVQTEVNAYFPFDTIEKSENSIDMQARINAFTKKYGIERKSGAGFLYALLEPPYRLQLEENITKRGQFFLDISAVLFDELKDLEVYTWSTDCSKIFDAGKEWWGCFFWTVYNPAKDMYIGIIGSSTD